MTASEVLWLVTGGPDPVLTCPVSAEEAGYAVTIAHCRACWLGSGLTLQGLSCEGTTPWLELLRWSVFFISNSTKCGDGNGWRRRWELDHGWSVGTILDLYLCSWVQYSNCFAFVWLIQPGPSCRIFGSWHGLAKVQSLWLVAWHGLPTLFPIVKKSCSAKKNEKDMLCGRHVTVHEMHDVCVIDPSSLVSEHKLMAWNGIALVQLTCSTLHFCLLIVF